MSAIFEKTANEALSVKGVSLARSAVLETAYVAAKLSSIEPDKIAWQMPEEGRRVEVRAPADAMVLRAESSSMTLTDLRRSEGGWLVLDEAQREMSRTAREVFLVGGKTVLGERILAGAPHRTGFRIPSLTIVRYDELPVCYFRPQVASMHAALWEGRVPADLAYVGAIGISGDPLSGNARKLR